MNCGKKGKILLIVACLMYLMDAILSSVKVYYNAKILDWAVVGDLKNMLIAILAVVGSCLGLLMIEAVSCIARYGFVSEAEINTKRQIIHSIMHRPISKFRVKDDAYYFNLLTTDIDTYRSDYVFNILLIFSWICYSISSSFMLYKLNPWLLLTGLVLAVLPVFANNMFTKISKKAKNGLSEASEKYAGVLQEIIKGYEIIRMDNSSEFTENRFHSFSVMKRKAANHNSFVQSMSMQAFYTFASLTTLAGIGVGAVLAIQGKLNAIMMIAAQSYFATLSNAISNITAYIVEMRATKDIRTKIKIEAEMVQAEDTGVDLAPVIEYKNIDFCFGERVLFYHFNCSFQPKKSYAIIGESGCGKSTLIKILLKYHEGYSGTVFLGGQGYP